MSKRELLASTAQVEPARKAAGEGWLEFSMADVGPGIPEHIQQQLFTPFFTTKTEGMGLGLSLCRTVVEQHGGFLAFEPVFVRLEKAIVPFLFNIPNRGHRLFLLRYSAAVAGNVR